MTESRSLAAALRLLLTVGFYTLAIGISGALLWIPYLAVIDLGRIHPNLALACLVAAGGVLWAIVPRPDKFEPSAPQLTRANAPAMCMLIDQIARSTSQLPPGRRLPADRRECVTLTPPQSVRPY
jgi:heat shock protein HtpX